MAQLRIVAYNNSGSNTADRTSQWVTIVSAIRDENVNGIARLPDAFVLSEQNTPGASGTSSSTASFVTLLNNTYGAGTYSFTTAAFTSGNDSVQTVVFRTASLQLISQSAVGTSSTGNNFTANARQVGKYQFRPVGYGSSADVWIYASHAKASQGTDSGRTVSNADRRAGEMVVIRQDVINSGLSGANVILAGDLNFYSTSSSPFTETGYRTITATGSGQLIDPLSLSNGWTGTSFRIAHTQSPATSSFYGGQVTGGMNDRFDFQLISPGLNDNAGVALIGGSYRAFGNSGTHVLNGAITTSTSTVTSSGVLLALAQGSDHIPVVADYQLPARMSVGTLAGAPGLVLRNTVAAVTVGISNATTGSVGFDTLAYSVSGSATGTGAVSPGQSFVQSLALPTSSAGPVTASFTITPTSQQVPDAAATRTASYTVVDGSNASFAAGADIDNQTIDFGVLRVGDSAGTTRAVGLFNIQAASGYTAPLALTSVRRRAEAAGGIAFNATSFASLAGGSSATFTAAVDTPAAGSYQIGYQLGFADGAAVLNGTASQAPLSLNLAAKVVAFAGFTPTTFATASSVSSGTIGELAGGPLPDASGDALIDGAAVPGFALTDAWSPSAFPTLDLGVAGEVAGSLTALAGSLFGSYAQFDVTLSGTSEAIARVQADWNLDGQIHGYGVAAIAGGLRVTYTGVDSSGGGVFDWNLRGTGATVLSITSVPEPGAAMVLFVPAGLLVRRRIARQVVARQVV